MKKALFVLLFLGLTSFNLYSQEEKESIFTHTLTESVGIIQAYQLMENSKPHLTINGGYSLLNLIPAYELGYNNKWFLKYKFRNLENEKDNDDIYLRINVHNLILNYNLLNKNSLHSFKIGAGYVLWNVSEHRNGHRNGDIKHNFLLSLSYFHKIDKHFSLGIEADLYGIIIYREYCLSLSYTF